VTKPSQIELASSASDVKDSAATEYATLEASIGTGGAAGGGGSTIAALEAK